MNLKRRIERFAFLFIFKISPNPSLRKRGFFMMLLLVVLLGMYLRGLRTANVYGLLSSPLFRKEGARGRFNYCNLFKINLPNPSLQKRGFFYDIAFSDFIRNIFERVKNGKHLFANKIPLFTKEGAFL